MNVGSKGSVKQVEEALRYLLGPNKKNDEVLSIPVVFEIGEMNVKVFKSSEMSEVSIIKTLVIFWFISKSFRFY